MLTKYTLDTNDNDIGDKALELRKRFAGRKLQEDINNGLIDDKLLVKFKDLNRNQRNEHGKEVIKIMESYEKNRTTIVRTEQQLNIQSKLRTLENDLSRTTRLNKSRVDALTDLEKRIIQLRQDLIEPQPLPGVEHVMIDQLSVNNKLPLQKLFKECSICKRKILVDLHEAHVNVCTKIKGETLIESRPPIYDVDIDLKTSLTTFIPQPPRNCKYIKKGYRYISFSWEPPIFDGGLPITNYEISYKSHTILLDPGTKMKIVKVKELPNIFTSQWCYRTPICHNGYKITGLDAGQSYIDFRIRSINLKGVSEWIDLTSPSDPSILTTNSPIEPWEPLFIHINKITSTCIHLDWEPPFFDGGSDIIRYEIKYTVFHRVVTATNRSNVVQKDYILKTPDSKTNFVIRNLPSSTKIQNVTICAITKAELKGKLGIVTWGDTINHTLPCSRYYQIQQEIQRASNHIGEFIDTDFYTGVAQKLYKKEYLEKLKKDILQYSPTDEENEESIIWQNILKKMEEKKRIEELTEKALAGDDDDDDDDNGNGNDGKQEGEYVFQNGEMKFIKKKKIDNFIFPYKIRKKHYQIKLQKIDETMLKLEKELIDIEINRVKNTTILSEKQKRLIDIQSEIDRVTNYDGIEIVSGVLQGVDMTYLVTTLKILLHNTWQQILSDIAKAKHEVIHGENRKKEIIKLNQQLKDEKKERTAKMTSFLTEYEKQQRIMTNLVQGSSRYALLKGHFDKLKRYVIHKKQLKDDVKNAFITCAKRFLKSAFEKWLTGKFSHELDNNDPSGGLGSVLLNNARKLREEIQSTLRQEIAQTNQISKQLKIGTLPYEQHKKLISSEYLNKMEEGMNSQQMVIDGGMKFLYEGDGYTLDNKFNEAETCYDAQIIYLRSRKPLNIKYLAMCHGRLGKLYLRKEKYDRAIVEFDRQMSLANEINDKIEIADSYFGLGTGYFNLLEYRESIRYLEIAQSRYETIGNIPKHCGCLVIMKECYNRLNKKDLVDIYNKKILEIENELKYKIQSIYSKIDKMTTKLRLNAAVFELEVKIERSSLRILDLKKELDNLHDQLIDENETLESQRKICRGIEGLLEAIQKELDFSKETDEHEMMSYLVHDNPQMVNVEEVKTRLHKRRLEVLDKYKQEKDIELAIITRIKNIENHIAIDDDEVNIELGDLMRKVKNNKPFRTIAFNPANSASDEVTGTATGGVENFICAESNNIHVIDYHNGELLHVYPGDSRSRLGDKQGHIGVITCLAYDMNRIYSGSADETIMIWDNMTKERIMVLTGHEGSIVSLALHSFMLMSGGADATIRLWDKITGKELRIIHGHSESVLSIDLGPTWMVTASSDEEVRVWSIKEKSRHTIKVDTKFRLQGHNCPVTVAKYGKLEVVSGDKKGDIIVWWIETGAIVQHIKNVHNGRINCLQFDATRIVSGGSDNNVCITDIGTGKILQTLRGHTGHIICLSFDTERILSASRDSTLRYWKWGDKRHQPADKYHMLAPTDSLPLIAKTYELDLETLLKWNGIKDIKQCYPGMRLIVRKANPDQLTKAELAEFDKQRRRMNGIKQTDKKIHELQLEKGTLYQQHSRVYKIATDIDPVSLGNRMFRQQKLNSELFPEKSDLYTDYQSLGSRIKSNTGKGRNFGGRVVRYLTTKANENEWGDISDELAIAMLETFIEFQVYELVTEEKKLLRDSLSVLGRMNMPLEVKARNTKLILGASSKANINKPGKKEELEKALEQWKLPPVIEEKTKKSINGNNNGNNSFNETEDERQERIERRKQKKKEREMILEKRRLENQLKDENSKDNNELKLNNGNNDNGGEDGNRNDSNGENYDDENHSASDDEDDEDERDELFNRKKYRQNNPSNENQTKLNDIQSGIYDDNDDNTSDNGSNNGSNNPQSNDYGLIFNRRKYSNSSSSSITQQQQQQQHDDVEDGSIENNNQLITNEAIKALENDNDGDGDMNSSQNSNIKKSKSSLSTSTTKSKSKTKIKSQPKKPNLSVSSIGSSQSSVSKHSIDGTSIHVDDQDADLLSLLKQDKNSNLNDDGDY